MARRKKSIKKDTTPKIKELRGYRLGDVVHTKTASGDIRVGEIVRFHPDDNQGPAFTFLEIGDGKYLAALIEWIIEKPTASQKKKALRRR